MPILAPILAIATVCGLPLATPLSRAVWPTSQSSRGVEESTAQRLVLDSHFADELLELSKLAARDRMFAQRDRLCEIVLLLEPDNAVARDTLRFERIGGAWTRRADYRPALDHAEPLAYAHRERFLAAYGRYRESLFALLGSDEVESASPAAVPELQRLRDIEPDDARVRDLLGEVRWDGRWVLGETRVAAERKLTVVGAAQAALETAPESEPSAVEAVETSADLLWITARRNARVRVVGTVPEDEIVRTAKTVHAVGDLFAAVFGACAPYRRSFTLYVLRNPAEGRELVERWPGLSPEQRKWLGGLQGGWLDETTRAAEWSADDRRRLDGAARQTVGMLLRDTWGIGPDCGWAWEGVGLYLVHRLLGTRLTWFVEGESYGYSPGKTGGPTELPADDWLNAAHDAARRDGLPRLAFLLAYRAGDMRQRELLGAWALVSFLIEGRPREAPAILSRVGAGENAIDVLEDELGTTLPRIEQRIATWLCETSHGAHCADANSDSTAR